MFSSMGTAAITILGLGPGNIDDLTLHAFTLLREAASRHETVYFRTLVHPTIAALQRDLPDLGFASFDQLYDDSADWATLYQQIATEVCTLATQRPVLYAVPGHPLVGESSVPLIQQMAQERNLSVSIVSGLSFLEPLCTILGVDPFEHGLQLVDATNLATLASEEVAGKILPTVPLLVGQLYNRRLASAVKLSLSECYPDEWQVKLIRAAGVTEEETVLTMPLYELDRNSYANHLSTLYVPPVDALTALRLPETLRFITMRLRRSPDGCPWDREQTHQSLIKYVIEETYEVVEALEEHDMDKLAEELGDLLLQVYLHAEIARQEGDFTIGDVFEHVTTKMIRRHPHVFGTTEAHTAGQVLQNWETIKKQERARAGKDISRESVLDGVPPALPALIVAQEYQKRASKTGFEFPDIHTVYQKLTEELQELQHATTPAEQLEEMGDVLFITAKIARFLQIEAEEALRRANRKFLRRFQAMEAQAHQQGRALSSYNSQEWEEAWQQAKVQG